MVQINFAQKSVTVKIVYYGPGMSGKTTNLEVVHQRAPQGSRGDLTSISTDGDRTLFFDFMPLDLGTVAGMRTQFQIYTVPGQVYYNSTRKLVLQGVDGVIFIADSSASMLEENLESLRNLEENLAEYGKTLTDIPCIIQYNKRDLPDAMSVDELNAKLNPHGLPNYEAIANSGQGVFPTLKALAALVLDSIHDQTGNRSRGQSAPAPAPAPPMATPLAPPAGGMGAAPAAQAPVAGMPEPPAPMPGMAPAPPPVAQAPQAPVPQPPPAPPTMQQPPVQHSAPIAPIPAAPQAPAPHMAAPEPVAPEPVAPAPNLGQTGFFPQPAAPAQQPQQQQQPAAPALGQTGFFPQPAPQEPQAAQPVQPPAPPGSLMQTGFHQQPQAAGAPPLPAAPDLSQTGFQPLPQAPQAPQAPQMAQPAPPMQPQQQAQAPAQPELRLGAGLQRENAPALPSSFSPGMQQGAAPQGGMQQPQPQPQAPSMGQPAPAPVGSTPQASAKSQAPAAPTRLKPRAVAATPSNHGKKSSMVTAVFVVIALVAGAVIGGLAFNLF